MTPPQGATITMEGVRIIFRNFRGEGGPFNPPGTMNFGVILDERVANDLEADDWPVKWLEPREEDEDETRTPWLPVELKYRDRNGNLLAKPPRVFIVTDDGRNELTESQVHQLDGADIVNIDMIVRAFNWEFNDKHGTKAMLQSLYVTIEEDELEKKYRELDRRD